MTTESGAPAGDIAAPADTSELSITEARAMLDAQLAEPEKEQPAESADDATAEPESSQEDAAPEKDPGEDATEAEPAEEPPIEPPRSWTKAEKERFQSLPRETQEYLHTREQERERDFRRSQNELAEQRNAVKAEREASEKARQQYEEQLPALMQSLQDAQQSAFSDIRSVDDVTRLANDDPFRYLQWQAHQTKLQAVNAELERAKGKQAQEQQGKRAAYEAEQNKLLVDMVPEMADPKKAGELRERAVKMLNEDLGLKTDLLSRWMTDDTGHEILSNAGIQKLIADGLKYRDILNAPKPVASKTLPPVQKPGTARPAGGQDSETIQGLEKRLNQTGSEKDAWALYEAKLKAQSRRAS
jgi:hypothetical protein